MRDRVTVAADGPGPGGRQGPSGLPGQGGPRGPGGPRYPILTRASQEAALERRRDEILELLAAGHPFLFVIGQLDFHVKKRHFAAWARDKVADSPLPAVRKRADRLPKFTPGPDALDTLEDMDVSSLGLSSRARTALRRAGITRIGELARKSARELMRIDGFGGVCIAEVEVALWSVGLEPRAEGGR